MGKNIGRIMGPLAVMMIVICIVGYRGGAFGVPADKLESFSRAHQPIPEEWLSIQTVRDDIAAFIFYPEDQSNASYVIYVKGTGLSFGYHSRSRGFMHSIQEGICEYQYSDRNAAIFLSLNQMNVRSVQIEYADGSAEAVELSPNEPFALVYPLSANVIFYDENGAVIEEQRAIVAI